MRNGVLAVAQGAGLLPAVQACLAKVPNRREKQA